MAALLNLLAPEVLYLIGLVTGLAYFGFHQQNRRSHCLLAGWALQLPAFLVVAFALRGINALRPYKLDPYFYRADGWLLGFEPAFAAGRLFLHQPRLLSVLLALVYEWMPIVMVAVWAGYLWRRPREDTAAVALSFLANLVCSVPCYLLLPACGPRYAFPSFPQLPLGVQPHPLLLSAPPNAVPSVHFSTALLVCWYARKLPAGRWFGGFYAVATTAATLGFGEHYLVDLLAAVPYAVVVHRLGHRLARPLCAPRLQRAGGL